MVLFALREKESKRKERNNAKQRFSVVICCRSDFDLNVEEKDRESGNQGVFEGLQVTLVGSSNCVLVPNQLQSFEMRFCKWFINLN